MERLEEAARDKKDVGASVQDGGFVHRDNSAGCLWGGNGGAATDGNAHNLHRMETFAYVRNIPTSVCVHACVCGGGVCGGVVVQ